MVRSGWFGVVLLLSLAFPAGAEVQYSDARGDGAIRGAVPSDGLDIVGGTIRLDGTNLTFTIDVADAAQAQDANTASLLADWEYWVEAKYRGDTFHIVIDMALGQFPDEQNPGQMIDTTTAWVYRQDETQPAGWLKLAEAVASTDRAASQLEAIVPVTMLEAGDGFVPGPGEPIEFIAVTSYFDEGPGSVHDSPREGGIVPLGNLAGGDSVSLPAGSYLALPSGGSGSITLATPDPVRFSNGEATTYHWPLSITNTATSAQEIVLEATGSADMEIRMPEVIRLDASSERLVDMFATVPFVHRHGGSRYLEISASSTQDKAVLPLEIRYLEVPQPAGHHPTIFLHADNPGGGQSGLAWMDTLDQPERPHDPEMSLQSAQCGDPADAASLAQIGAGAGLTWPLDPALKIGIDGRTEETAQLRATLDLPGPFSGGELRARFQIYSLIDGTPSNLPVDEYTVVMPIASSTAPSQVDLDFAVPLLPEMDYLPPAPERNLSFRLFLCSQMDPGLVYIAADLEPRVRHGAYLLMPLEEYHDTIPIDAAHGLSLQVESPQKRAPPGSTASWEIMVAGDSTYDVSLFGVSRELSTTSTERVSGGSTMRIQLEIPSDADLGDVFEIVVAVTDTKDPLVSAAVRLTVVADPSAPDTAGQSGSVKESPGLTPWALSLLVLTAAGARKRAR